jgi:hypothetical protein
MGECSLLSKIALVPGCRPWDTPNPVETDSTFQFQIPGVSTVTPWRPPDLNAGEFSLPESVKSTVTKVQANAARLVDSTKSILSQGEGPAWYDFTGKIASAASAANQAVQSTLIKIIVLVVIVGVVAMFGMSYVQSKGAALAK